MATQRSTKTSARSRSAFLKTSAFVAHYYGFMPSRMLVKRAPVNTKKKQPKATCSDCSKHADALLADAVQTVMKNQLHTRSQPLLFYNTNVEMPASRSRRHHAHNTTFGMHVVGSSESHAEGIAIRATLAALEEMGVEELCVALNSLGNRESFNAYTRELNAYFRRNLHALPAPCRQALQDGPLAALECVKQKSPALLTNIPRPMHFLNEDDRRHLREILEYLEDHGVVYELDEHLTNINNSGSRTVFEIRNTTDPTEDIDEYEVLAYGGRYDDLFHTLYQSNVPAVGSVLTFPQPPSRQIKLPNVSDEAPPIYLVQLGFDARLKGLRILEQLRRERIPVQQTLQWHKLQEQVIAAKQSEAAFMLIIGRKEALEDTVIVRDMYTRAQFVLSMDELPDYLKKRIPYRNGN